MKKIKFKINFNLLVRAGLTRRHSFTRFLLWMSHFHLKAKCFSGMYFQLPLNYALEETYVS